MTRADIRAQIIAAERERAESRKQRGGQVIAPRERRQWAAVGRLDDSREDAQTFARDKGERV